MTILHIENVSYYNEEDLHDISGIAGFCRRVKNIDDCHRYIDLGTKEERKEIGISERELNDMLAAYVLAGFTIYTKEG